MFAGVVNAVLRHYHNANWDELFSEKLKASLSKRLEVAERALEHESLPCSLDVDVKADV